MATNNLEKERTKILKAMDKLEATSKEYNELLDRLSKIDSMLAKEDERESRANMTLIDKIGWGNIFNGVVTVGLTSVIAHADEIKILSTKALNAALKPWNRLK